MKGLFKGCLTVPNFLTFSRIVMVPFIACLYLKGNVVAAVIVLALSGLTDLFDGKIARRFNQVSALGKVLDPVADKLTQITLAVLLFVTFNSASDKILKAFSWVFLVFILKEAVMVVGGAAMLAIGLRPGAAEIYGKVATFAYYTVMIIVICFGPEVGAFKGIFTLPSAVMVALVIISAILTLIAFASYMPGLKVQLKDYFSQKKSNSQK